MWYRPTFNEKNKTHAIADSLNDLYLKSFTSSLPPLKQKTKKTVGPDFQQASTPNIRRHDFACQRKLAIVFWGGGRYNKTDACSEKLYMS